MFPREASTTDKIAVHVKNLEQARLFVVDTVRYKSKKFSEHELVQGDVFMLEYPHILFTVFITTGSEPGDFQLTYSHVNDNQAVMEALKIGDK